MSEYGAAVELDQDEFDEAQPEVRLPFLRGNGVKYVLELERLNLFAGNDGDWAAVETKVVSATGGSDNNPVGESCVTLIKLFNDGKYKKVMGYGKLKALVGALKRIDPRLIKTAEINQAASLNNPFKGTLFGAIAEEKPTANGVFTKIQFLGLPAEMMSAQSSTRAEA